MKNIRYKILLCCTTIAAALVNHRVLAQASAELYRPQFHFSPKAHWMNDPNGLVYLNGKYHMFFQHNPFGTTWGPMHWGHAISTDLVHWQEQPIALYPDSLGTIFSGSAVVDKNNTAGFGKNAVVAIFTHHNQKIEDAKTGLHQYQSIAYSNDEGETWTKYKGNPVLPNPGIWDFRDPKVSWHEATQQWIMTLATKQTVTFYGSKNLKNWNRLSEFGNGIGAHGGVWECPDLISLDYNGTRKWVLLVSINPGGPNGGSATQYFVGQFDGKTFVPDNELTRWVDYGADNYAGVTWSNTGNRKLFIGWMSNWQYANVVPTQNWRSATTIARELKLKKQGEMLYLASEPVKELNAALYNEHTLQKLTVKGNYDLSAQIAPFKGKCLLNIQGIDNKSFSVVLSNAQGNKVVIGYDKIGNQFYVDRTQSGNVNFEPTFARKAVAPRTASGLVSLKILLDVASAEVFADDGLTVLTNIYFPLAPLNQLHIQTDKPVSIKQIQYAGIKPTIE